MDNLTRPRMIITIDGPAGAGKSTAAQRLARSLGLDYLDTGAMYRALTLKALRDRVILDDQERLAGLARDLGFEMSYSTKQKPHYRVLMDGEDVTSEIRNREVSAHVSQVSSHQAVRKEMVKFQRQLAGRGGVVVEGRDVGTVVFPQADIKFFITATTRERARRRYRELKKGGYDISMKSIQQEMVRRDRLDSNRAVNPLRRAADAVMIDTTGISISSTVRRMLKSVRQRMAAAEVKK